MLHEVLLSTSILQSQNATFAPVIGWVGRYACVELVYNILLRRGFGRHVEGNGNLSSMRDQFLFSDSDLFNFRINLDLSAPA